MNTSKHKGKSKRKLPSFWVLATCLLLTTISPYSQSKSLRSYAPQNCISNGSKFCPGIAQYILVKDDQKLQELIDQITQICSDCIVVKLPVEGIKDTSQKLEEIIKKQKLEEIIKNMAVPSTKWSARISRRSGTLVQKDTGVQAGIPAKECPKCPKCSSINR